MRMSCTGVVMSVEVEVEEEAGGGGGIVLSTYALMVCVSLANLSLVDKLVEPLPMLLRSFSSSAKHLSASQDEIDFLASGAVLLIGAIFGELWVVT